MKRRDWPAYLPYLLLLAGAGLIANGLQPLNDFGDRVIGVSTLAGVNAAGRNSVYLGSWLLGCCLLYLLTGKRTPASQWPLQETWPEALIAAVLLSNAGLYLFSGNTVFLNTALLITAAAACVLGERRLAPADWQSQSLDQRWLRPLLAYQLSLSAVLLLGDSAALLPQPLWLILAYSLLVLAQRRWPEYYNARVSQLFWLLLILWPVLWVLGRELHHVQGWPALIVLAIGVGLIIRPLYHNMGSSGALRHRLFWPALLISNVVVLEYQVSVFNLHDYDYYHLGEMVVPLQQGFQYGSLPFIDYYPIHGLFDLLPQLFYKLLKPAADTEALVWGQGYMMGWLPRALAIWLLYSVLSHLLRADGAFLLLFLLPSYHLVHPYYTPLLIPLLIILASRDMQHSARWLAICIPALILWRPDFGAAATTGFLGLIALRWRNEGSRSALGLLKPMLISAAVCLLIFSLLALWQERQPLSLLLQIVNYLSIQTVVASWPALFKSIGAAELLQYAVLPLVGCLALVVALRSNGRLNWHQGMLFLAVVCLVLGMRSLHRHTLYVGYFNAYLYPLLGIMLLLSVRQLSERWLVPLILVYTTALFAVFPERRDVFNKVYYSFGVNRELPALASPTKTGQSELFKPIPSSPRLSQEPAPPIIDVLTQSLNGQQSFYDFTNSPLLYALSGRPLPGYLMETIYQSGERAQSYLIEEMAKQLQNGDLPLVIMRQGNDWDNKDGVANELRSFRMAEFVFKHFEPCMQYERYKLWAQSGGDFCNHLHAVAANTAVKGQPLPLHMQQNIDLGELPWLWANGDSRWRAKLSSAQSLQSQQDNGWLISHNGAGSDYLLLGINVTEAAQATIRWGESSGQFMLRPGRHQYLLRLGIWHRFWKRPAAGLYVNHPGQLLDVQLVPAD